MKFSIRRPRGLAVTALLAALAVAACDDEVAVTDVTADRPVLNLLIGPGDAALPTSSAAFSGIRISGFNVSVLDAFDRASGALGMYSSQATSFGNASGFNIRAALRNSTNDPRRPLLTSSTAAAGTFLGLFNPAFTGCTGCWDLFGNMSGLKPNTTYTIVLARMAVVPSGALDQTQRLTGFPVAQPDSLVFLGGTETGFATNVCNFSAPVTVEGTMNPVALGTQTTNAEGAMAGPNAVDCWIVAGSTSPWWKSRVSATPPGAADSTPSGPNTETGQVRLGQYNYVLFYEGAINAGDPVPSGAPVARAQIGPDIDLSGNIINNAYAPYPTATITGNFSALPGGANAFATPGTITLTASGLPTLGSKSYVVYLFDREAGTYAPAAVKITHGGVTSAATQTFDSPGDTATFTITLDDESGVDFGEFSHIVISMESGGPQATPSSRFLFKEYLTSSNALSSGAFTFGTFDPAAPRAFQIAGSGTGSFFGDSLLVNLQGLAPPPEGFHYQSYLGRQVGPNVEASVRLHTITLDALGAATDRIAESEVGDFSNYNTYFVILEPNDVTVFTTARIHASQNYIDKFGRFFADE